MQVFPFFPRAFERARFKSYASVLVKATHQNKTFWYISKEIQSFSLLQSTYGFFFERKYIWISQDSPPSSQPYGKLPLLSTLTSIGSEAVFISFAASSLSSSTAVS